MSFSMEHNLDMPLDMALPIIQNRITYESTYFGIRTLKNPNDIWVYQEIIFATKPDVIVEIGIYNGGSTLYFAHLFDLIGKGRVIGIDLTHETVPSQVKQHKRITLLEGDACAIFDKVRAMISPGERVLVIEDSSHTYDNTLQVLRKFSPLIRPGDYFIVEDSICYHGLDTGFYPGPYEAVKTFMQENADFTVDRSKEFLITWNPMGYLRRKGGNDVPVPERSAAGLAGASSGAAFKVLRFLRPLLPPIMYNAIRKRFKKAPAFTPFKNLFKNGVYHSSSHFQRSADYRGGGHEPVHLRSERQDRQDARPAGG